MTSSSIDLRDDQDSHEHPSSDSNGDESTPEVKSATEAEPAPFPRRRCFLNINKKYVRSWNVSNAVRELIQNWEDALRTSYHIKRSDFCPVIQVDPRRNCTSITLRRPSHNPNVNGDLVGYILFRKRRKTLEFTNFKAGILEEHLLFGGSSKIYDKTQAGGHGEGLKVAAFVLTRAGYKVEVETVSWVLTFKFDKRDRFYYLPSPIKGARATKPRRNDELVANSWEDVKVLISKGKDRPEGITELDFDRWTDVSFDIKSPRREQIKWTSCGALAFDLEFAGRIYLKGLRMTDGSASGRNFHFCYNFFEGATDRDRHSMTAPREEARLLAKIWAEAILTGHDTTDRYIDLLQNHHKTAADVAQADDHATPATSRLLYQRLRSLHPHSFFYCESNESELDVSDQRRVIQVDLNRQPFLLSPVIWKILKRNNLVVDPFTHRRNKFLRSPSIPIPSDRFARNIAWLLQACMAVHPVTSNIRLEIREAGQLNADAIMLTTNETDCGEVLVHSRWFDILRAHRESPCSHFKVFNGTTAADLAAISASHKLFSCDHIVTDLLESIIREVGDKRLILESDRQTMRRYLRIYISQTPRHVRVLKTQATGELEVRWDTYDLVKTNPHGESMRYIILLHRDSTCAARRHLPLHVAGPLESSAHNGDLDDQQTYQAASGRRPENHATAALCGCPSKTVSHSETQVVFRQLQNGESYFPMIAQIHNGQDLSFYGVPPASTNPKPFILQDIARNPHLSTPTVPANPRTELSNLSPGTSPHSAQRMPFRTGDLGGSDDGTDCSNVDMTETETPVVVDMSDANSTISPPGPATPSKSLAELYQEDQQAWDVWSEVSLPRIFATLSPARTQPDQSRFQDVRYLDANLPFDIQAESCAHARIRDLSSCEYVLYIHSVGVTQDNSILLKVTKHMLLKHSPLKLAEDDFQGDDQPFDEHEVLMHFNNASQMGLADDAEIISMEDFELLGRVDDGISYLPPTTNSFPKGYFCRFAVTSGCDPGEACIRPLSSRTNLLAHKDRTLPPRFEVNPRFSLFDLTPGIVGMAEGFSESAFSIAAALGFDPTEHLTWRCRYKNLGTEVFDGPSSQVLQQFLSEDLRAESLPSPKHPRVVCCAGINAPFRFVEANSVLPTQKSFCEPLEILKASISSRLKPDFAVLVTSSAMLHESVTPQFRQSVRDLLEHGYAVHLKLVPLSKVGLPQRRRLLVVLASKIHDIQLKDIPYDPLHNVHSYIDDLRSANPRSSQDPELGFVYTQSLGDDLYDDASEQIPTRNVFNHQTGFRDMSESQRGKIDMASNNICLCSSKMDPLVHPHRDDLLTVREICRLQGLDDDFVLYGSREQQYTTALNAVPPAVTAWLASSIVSWITGHDVLDADTTPPREPLRKRARVFRPSEAMMNLNQR